MFKNDENIFFNMNIHYESDNENENLRNDTETSGLIKDLERNILAISSLEKPKGS